MTHETVQTDKPSTTPDADATGAVLNVESQGSESNLPWASYGITILLSLLVSICMLIGYHVLAGGKSHGQMATIDVAEVMSIKEMQLTIAVTKKDVTDIERAAAYDSIKAFAKDLESAIEAVQSECECALLVKAAVVKGLPDHTPLLKKKLSMDGASVDGLVQILRSQGTELPNKSQNAIGAGK